MNEQVQILVERILAFLEEEEKVHLPYFLSRIRELQKDTSKRESFFSSLLALFVHYNFSEEEAFNHWIHIIEHAEFLTTKLQRPVGLRLPIVDYFINYNRLISHPIIIEFHLFKQTEEMAMIDSLTGVFNRRYMELSLQKEINRSLRYNKKFSILILDLDDFKRINDTRGHLFGDEVLRRFAEFVRSHIRLEDILCRYGGEEFLILLPETDSERASYFANRIIRRLHDHPFFAEHGVRFSGGIATFPDMGGTIPDLLAQADKALYQAKFEGKNRVIVAPKDRRKHIRHPRQWEVWLSYQQENKTIHEHTFTENASLGGIRIISQHVFTLETPIHIQIKKSNSHKEPTPLEGTLVWGRKIDAEEYAYGIAFNHLSEKDIEDLSLDLPKSNLYSDM
ncbi:diguanylate cyclase [Thermospira aquatica]|uniref:diguanylate cyclase n=1 Tax=Thermospira aquatica TaxID=2828656 RepID=A0AAX3BBM5_9SPIR|nr:diguanylate cyclase [Thermospira aquatica]URA09659.1 diguanylate cyclase [Thermospira aquatica]